MKKFKVISISIILSVAFVLSSCSGLFKNDTQQKLEDELNSLKAELQVQNSLISSLLGSTTKKEETKNEAPTQNTSNKEESKPEEEKSEFEFIENETGVTITKYNGKSASVKVPEQLGGKYVTAIGKNAFADTEIKTISLPSRLTYIDWFAFYYCYALSTVYIPESVKEIGYGAFDGCSKRLTLYSTSGSYTERFAKSFGITFSAID